MKPRFVDANGLRFGYLELGTGPLHELLERLLCRRPALLAGRALGVPIAPIPGPAPVPLARQAAQLRFQAVVVSARELLAPGAISTASIAAPFARRSDSAWKWSRVLLSRPCSTEL